MEVTGKAEKDFEKWFNEKYFPIDRNATAGYATSVINKGSISLARFWHLDDSMQWGVYVDFFTHKGIRPSIIDNWPYYTISFSLYDGDKIGTLFSSESLEETRREAITKACEIYNTEK